MCVCVYCASFCRHLSLNVFQDAGSDNKMEAVWRLYVVLCGCLGLVLNNDLVDDLVEKGCLQYAA